MVKIELSFIKKNRLQGYNIKTIIESEIESEKRIVQTNCDNAKNLLEYCRINISINPIHELMNSNMH